MQFKQVSSFCYLLTLNEHLNLTLTNPFVGGCSEDYEVTIIIVKSAKDGLKL